MEIKYLKYENSETMRIDKFLKEELEDISRTLIQDLIKGENILVNGKAVKANYNLKQNDEIKVTILDPEVSDIVPQDIPLDIYYEDEDVIVINKPSGMVVHPGCGNYDNTLVNALMYHCKDLSNRL